MQSTIVLAMICHSHARVGQFAHTPTGVHALATKEGFELSLYAVRKAFKELKELQVLSFHGNHYTLNSSSGVLIDINSYTSKYIGA